MTSVPAILGGAGSISDITAVEQYKIMGVAAGGYLCLKENMRY